MPPKSSNPSLSPLYVRYLSVDEKASLAHSPADDFSSEINLLRVLNSLLLKFQRSAPADLNSRIQTLRTCVVLSEQLACLMRIQSQFEDPCSEVEKSIEAAVEALAEEWSLA